MTENVSVPGRYKFVRSASERRYFTEEAIVEANSLEEAWQEINEGDPNWESIGDDWWDDWEPDNAEYHSTVEEPIIKSKEFLFLAGYNG